MKHLVKIIALSLVLVMAVAMLASCDNSGKIKKAFEKEGYTVSSVDATSDDAKTLLTTLFSEDQMEEIAKYEIILCKMDGILNVGKTAIIIKFPAADDIKDLMTTEKDGEKDTAAYDKAVESGSINGNCMIITLSPDSLEIFKNA